MRIPSPRHLPVIASVCGALGLGLTSCTSDNPSAGRGAAAGAVAGALFGAVVNDDDQYDEIWKSAAIGAGVGAIVGHARKAQRYNDAGGNPSAPQSYPTGGFTNQPGYVRSPYPPNNVIDVTGFRSGELAIDPTTNQVFRVP